MPLTNEHWQRVKEIFDAVVDLPPQERAATLEKNCADDTTVRREVESLLQSDAQSDGFIENGIAEVPRDLLDRHDDDSAIGRQFGAYKIIREIGRGGLGTVYLAARADEQYQKQVAIKLVRRGLDTDDILRRFRNERQILAQLDHPNIARLIDGGTTDEGLPYFVMEFIEGEPILSYCDTHNLSTTERLKLFRKVCAAVTYAHQHAVIHRDLKPSNILVTAEGESKLLDFGIAKLLSADDALFTVTMPALRVMTPEYASPEQIKGGNITTTSDVYSLGVLLFELLTGERPYRLKTRTPDEIAHAITEQEPTRPSTAIARSTSTPLRNLKSLRGDLDNIVLMAMRKEPARRYASVGQFSEDIRRHLEGLPVLARKDTVAYRASKFIKRHRLGVAAALLVLLSLLGGIVATLRQARTAQRERVKAEAISGFLQGMLNASSPDSSLHARDLKVKDVLDEASKRLATEDLSGQPGVKAELQRIIGTTYFSLGQYDLAERNLTAALEAQTRIYGEDSAETLMTLVPLATLWGGAKGEYAKADKVYRQKLSPLRAAQKKGTISADYLITALNGFAILRRAQGDSKQAEMLLREELTFTAQVSPASKNDLGVAEAVLALILADQGKFDEAVAIVRKKIAAIPQTKGETPELCAILTGFGSFLMEKGDLAEAEKNLREAETVYRKLYDRSNMQLGDNLRLQAQAFYLQQQYAEAEARINETLEIYRSATSPQYINYATALVVQGLIYSQTGRPTEAEKLLREAVQLRATNMPETHFLRATANGALGEFLTAQKRFPEAEPLLLASYESLRKSQATNSPRTKLALERLASLYQAWNKPEKATPYRASLEANAKSGVSGPAEPGKSEHF